MSQAAQWSDPVEDHVEGLSVGGINTYRVRVN